MKEDDRVCAVVVAKYLAGFERKNNYVQDSNIMDIGIGLLKPLDMGADKFGTACCTTELSAWTWRMFSTQQKLICCVRKGWVWCWVLEMKGSDQSDTQQSKGSFHLIRQKKKGNHAIKNNDHRIIHLKNHFKYLHKLAEDRAVKVIKTVVDGEGARQPYGH